MPRGGQTRGPSCLCGECRKCRHRDYMLAWRAANIERSREIARECYARNAQEYRDRARAHREANIERYRAYDRERGHRVYDEQKEIARRAFNKAVIRGQIVRQPCEVCGVSKAEGHHGDYSKPLDVRWLCRTHHMQLHRRVAA